MPFSPDEFDPSAPPPPPATPVPPGRSAGPALRFGELDLFADAAADDPFAPVESGPDQDAGESAGGVDASPDADVLARPSPPVAAPAQAAEGPQPFPQVSTVRRGPNRGRERDAPKARLRPRAKVGGESTVSVVFWSLVVVAAIVFGALVGMNRDPFGLSLALGLPQVGAPLQLRSQELVAGLYPTGDGKRLLYVRGEVQLDPVAAGGRTVRVEARLLGSGGAEIGRSSGLAGALPTSEELAAVRDPDSWDHLSRSVASRLSPSAEESVLPFVLAFPAVKEAGGPLRIEVAATFVEEPRPEAPEPLPVAAD